MKLNKPDWALLTVCLLAVAQVAVVLPYATTLYYTFKTSAYDIGTYVQAMHNLFNGRGLLVTVHAPPKSLLAGHFSPILYTLAPAYALWPDAMIFRFANAALLASAAIPIYLCALHFTRHSLLSVILAASYLFNPFVINAAVSVWDLHEIAFAVPIIASLYLFLLRANKRWFLIGCLLLLMVKEHYGLTVAGFGILWWIHHKERPFGLKVAIGGLTITCIILGLVMPVLSPTSAHFMLQGQERYAWISDPLNHQDVVLQLTLSALPYLALLGIGTLWVSFYAWCWLLPGVADLAVNLASTSPMMRSPYSYHSVALMAVFTVAAARGLTQLMAKNPRLQPRDAVVAITIVTAMLAYGYANLPCCYNLWELDKRQLSLVPDDEKAIENIQAMIPSKDPIAVQNNIGPHFSARSEIYSFSNAMGPATWIVLRIHFPYRYSSNIFGSPYLMSCRQYVDAVQNYLHDPAWRVEYWNAPWLVLSRRARETTMDSRSIEEAINAVHNACVYAGATMG